MIGPLEAKGQRRACRCPPTPVVLWWTRPDSNRRSPACKAGAFPLGHGPRSILDLGFLIFDLYLVRAPFCLAFRVLMEATVMAMISSVSAIRSFRRSSGSGRFDQQLQPVLRFVCLLLDDTELGDHLRRRPSSAGSPVIRSHGRGRPQQLSANHTLPLGNASTRRITRSPSFLVRSLNSCSSKPLQSKIRNP